MMPHFLVIGSRLFQEVSKRKIDQDDYLSYRKISLKSFALTGFYSRHRAMLGDISRCWSYNAIVLFVTYVLLCREELG